MMNEISPQQTKAMTLRTALEQYKGEIARALPAHISPDRILRIALTSARKNPELLECTPESFLGAVIQAAQLGLEPDTPIGHAYLIPFRNNKTGRREVNFMTGYRGLMDLVYRKGSAPIMLPAAVYEGDLFEYQQGTSPKLVHTPMPRLERPKLTHVYLVASFSDGRREFMVMTKQEVEEVRARSQAVKFSPWKTDYEAMAFKTIIRRMVKYLPMSVELQTAVGLDEKAELGHDQNNDHFLKSGDPVTKSERIADKFDPNFDAGA